MQYKGTVRENVRASDSNPILRLEATDPDAGDNGRVR